MNLRANSREHFSSRILSRELYAKLREVMELPDKVRKLTLEAPHDGAVQIRVECFPPEEAADVLVEAASRAVANNTRKIEELKAEVDYLRKQLKADRYERITKIVFLVLFAAMIVTVGLAA